MIAIAGVMMGFDSVNCTYIVAGDEMARVMSEKHPDRKIVPFREDLSKGFCRCSSEDLSKGFCNGFSIDSEFIRERASFWGVSSDEYTKNLQPIIRLDITDELVLCFGDDECCKANLKFLIGYLRVRGYDKPLRVNIVDEYTLELLNEYFVD